MDHFIVSARKYRPDTFKTVVGQEAITTTLKNSIKTQHLAHAYLFCGPRGVGKTTCARIFAKTINCLNLSEDTEPCNECDSCKAFNKSGSFNIHELDAASNNSVDDIRTLIDQVRIPPQMGKYSVYIIDEVHMLSSQAFNAFLKTLEEPPAHAIFILATTEKHKIIPTILSRCQIFDFNRIGIRDIVNHLQYVAGNEGVSAEIDALNIIAQKADGALRDALSLFDQVVSFCGTTISYQQVIDNLNVLDYDYYFKLTDAFLKKNIPDGLRIFDEILRKGFDSQYFITGLSEHFRDLLVCQDVETLQLLEKGDAIRDCYQLQATEADVEFILKALDISNQCDLTYKTARNKRLHVELALVKIASINGFDDRPKSSVSDKIQEAKPIQSPVSTVTAPKPQVSEDGKKERVVSADTGMSRPISVSIKTKPVPETKEVEPAKVTSDIQSVNNNSFTQEQLTNAWLSFAEQRKATEPSLATTLNTCKPELGDDFKVQIPIAHSLQESSIRRIYNVLLDYLKRELSNDSIAFDFVEIADTVNEDDNYVIYTDKQKFEHMNKKNPNLAELKNKLGLDFDL